MVVRRLWHVSDFVEPSLASIPNCVYTLSSVSIIFFSVIASAVKRNANGARTFLEIVKARFGTPAHLMFLVRDPSVHTYPLSDLDEMI